MVSQPPKSTLEEILSLSPRNFAAVDPIRPTEFTPAPKQETPTERKIRLSQEAIAASASKPAGGISGLFKGPKPVISKPSLPAPRPIISQPVAPKPSLPTRRVGELPGVFAARMFASRAGRPGFQTGGLVDMIQMRLNRMK